MTEVPSMFDSTVNFGGITVEVDPINRARSEKSDNVMAMFYEEQHMMWEFVKEELQNTIEHLTSPIDFLDVGTGSGVWSFLVGKNTTAKHILAIDKSERAIQQAHHNVERNRIHSITLRHEFYNISSAPYRSVKTIGLYPPYHLYPSDVELKIPQHARGGIDGQQVFREQLCTANYHLADGGILVFNQMCLGDKEAPAFAQYIPELMDGVSLEYTNIFPPIDTAEFLEGIYGDAFADYQRTTAGKFPKLYYCNGIIRRDGRGETKVIQHSIPLKGRSWTDRIELHREIAKHGE